MLSATGLASNMAFDPASGTFSFTPSSTQAGRTFVVNFTATDSNNPALTKTESVPIQVQGSTSAPSGGGFCLSCVIPRGLSLTMWLLVIGGLIGVMSSIAILNIRAHSELAGMRRRHHNATGIPRHQIGQGHSAKIRAITEHHHRNSIRHYEDN